MQDHTVRPRKFRTVLYASLRVLSESNLSVPGPNVSPQDEADPAAVNLLEHSLRTDLSNRRPTMPSLCSESRARASIGRSNYLQTIRARASICPCTKRATIWSELPSVPTQNELPSVPTQNERQSVCRDLSQQQSELILLRENC